jgi:fructose-bisphosphate aldolase class II
MSTFDLKSNRTYQILKAAEEGKYGVVAPIVYNVSTSQHEL